MDGEGGREVPDRVELAPSESSFQQTGDFERVLGLAKDLFEFGGTQPIEVTIQGEKPLTVGQFVSFDVQVRRPGSLALFDISPDGKLVQVFPSRLASSDHPQLVSGEVLTIPSGTGANGMPLRIQVTEPAGRGFLLAILVENPADEIERVLPKGLTGGLVGSAQTHLNALFQALQELSAPEGESLRWSAKIAPYAIAP